MNSSYFYLDPDYQAGTPLKFSTVSEVSLRETVLFTLTAIAFLGVAVGVFVNGLQLDEQYVNNGEVVPLTVTACQMVKPYSTSNATVPKISYTYHADKTLSGTDRVNGDCEHYHAGTIISGMYLRTDTHQSRAVTPEMLHLPPLKRHGERLILFGFPILTGFFAIGGLLNYYRARRRYPRLRKTGQTLDGKIVRVQPFRVQLGKPSELQVIYGFRSPSGKYIEREQTYTHEAMDKVTLPLPGTRVKIIYADDDTHVML